MSQVIQGQNLRLLFADTPPSITNTGGSMHQNAYAGYVFLWEDLCISLDSYVVADL
jgi:hypothetical protein